MSFLIGMLVGALLVVFFVVVWAACAHSSRISRVEERGGRKGL